MAKIIFIICAIIPYILANCSDKSDVEDYFSRSVHDFSIELSKRIAVDSENHFVTSTLSTWALLAYTSLGATGGSLRELQTTLRLHPHKCYNYKFFEIKKSIYAPVGETTLESTSVMFVDERIPLKDRFQREVMHAGISDISKISIDNYEYVAAAINSYVKSATHGAIDEIVVASDLENVALMIVDALRFKGTWEIPFPVNQTKKSPFHDGSSKITGEVNLMTITDNFHVLYMDELEASVVQLPYSGDRFSMLLFVPYENVKVNNVIYSLKKYSLKTILKKIKMQETQEISLSLPRFKISSDLNNLKELLVDMGLRDIFEESRASFSSITDVPLYISNVIQKADVEVTEEGTIASAASKAEFFFKSLPVPITADKPFYFTIVDQKTSIPIFTGAYSIPSVY